MDLVIFTEKILNGKLHFLCSESGLSFFENRLKTLSRKILKMCQMGYLRLLIKVLVGGTYLGDLKFVQIFQT